MKASEAKPLQAEELQTLRSLLQRWVLSRYPYYGGSSEESDATQTYISVRNDAKVGHMPKEDKEELKDFIKKYGEKELD